MRIAFMQGYYYFRGMFRTFKAVIHGSVSIREGEQQSVDRVVTFTKYRIRVDEAKINRLYFDPLLVQPIADGMEYEFDKRLNREDKKMFSIILKHRLNQLDNGLHHLDIDLWNKIRANIIHRRYWVDREKEWFVKTLIATIIGFAFALIANTIGYRQGYQNGLKEGKHQIQDSIQKLPH